MRATFPRRELLLLAAEAAQEAYGYWLKANAQLQSMGIYPLPLPDVLRGYESTLELDE